MLTRFDDQRVFDRVFVNCITVSDLWMQLGWSLVELDGVRRQIRNNCSVSFWILFRCKWSDVKPDLPPAPAPVPPSLSPISAVTHEDQQPVVEAAVGRKEAGVTCWFLMTFKLTDTQPSTHYHVHTRTVWPMRCVCVCVSVLLTIFQNGWITNLSDIT